MSQNLQNPFKDLHFSKQLARPRQYLPLSFDELCLLRQAAKDADKIEAELIASFGVRSRGGLLVNKVRPNPDNISGKSRVNVPDGCYEKAQMGLELLKDAILELARANPTGIRNAEAAKQLGLQSDYGGGARDYLTYSVLGLLMRDGKMARVEKPTRHIVVTR